MVWAYCIDLKYNAQIVRNFLWLEEEVCDEMNGLIKHNWEMNL
jgi:hypothetical protein